MNHAQMNKYIIYTAITNKLLSFQNLLLWHEFVLQKKSKDITMYRGIETEKERAKEVLWILAQISIYVFIQTNNFVHTECVFCVPNNVWLKIWDFQWILWFVHYLIFSIEGCDMLRKFILCVCVCVLFCLNGGEKSYEMRFR